MFKKIKLDYNLGDFEPVISKNILETHYNKNYSYYEKELNKALENKKIPENINNIEDLVKNYLKLNSDLHIPIRQFGGGMINHAFYFSNLKKGTKLKDEKLIDDINKTFGSFTEFKNKFIEKALNIFGSGWTWLVIDKFQHLRIYNTYNQDNPWFLNMTPLISLDVWEHAYYFDYQDDRKKYIENMFKLFNWEKVEKIYLEAKNNNEKK